MNTISKVQEKYLPIKEFDGMYQVSNYGNVYSMHSGVSMKPWKNNKGYVCVRLQGEDKQYNRLVHRLVLISFLGDPGPGWEGNHKNGNKEDNRLENLEWSTRRQNIDHAIKTGLVDNKFENNPQSVLTLETVDRLRELNKTCDVPVKEIAFVLGVSKTTIRDVLSHRTWKNAQDFRK